MVVGLTITDSISAYHQNVVNSNPADDKVYSIQHYVIMLLSELRKVDGFLWVFRFPIPHTIKTPIATLGLDMRIIYNSSTLENKFISKITG
jgi:hypothetical protein